MRAGPLGRMALTLVASMTVLGRAGAENGCGTIRLDAPGRAFSKIPVFDQSKGDPWDPNLCYAIVAAQLRDADRFAKGDKLDRLSAPLSIALNHKASVRGSGLDGKGFDTEAENENVIGPGSPRAAILLNNDRNVCDLKVLERYASVLAGHQESGSTTSANFLYDVGREMDLLRMSEKERRSVGRFDDLCTDCRRSSLDRLKDLFAVVERAIPENRRYILEAKQFVDKLCENQSTRFTVAAPKLTLLKSPEQMRPELDARLEEGAPVGIGYCHEYLQTKSKCPAGHTSVVIGREKRGGECHYLVRDSYGQKCTARFRCEPDGSIWVPAHELSATASLLFHIPPK